MSYAMDSVVKNLSKVVLSQKKNPFTKSISQKNIFWLKHYTWKGWFKVLFVYFYWQSILFTVQIIQLSIAAKKIYTFE